MEIRLQRGGADCRFLVQGEIEVQEIKKSALGRWEVLAKVVEVPIVGPSIFPLEEKLMILFAGSERQARELRNRIIASGGVKSSLDFERLSYQL